MSLLGWPISKLPLTKKPVSSCFSTATMSKSKPYLLLDTKIKENVLKLNLYDPTGNKDVVNNLNIQDHSQTLGNFFQQSELIGSSRGHLALRSRKDSSVCLLDISNQAKPKFIYLPPLHFDNGERHVHNVSLSSPVNGDVIVAVKFSGSTVSLCRVGDSEWTRIDVPCPSFQSSTVVYSERDERFYLNNGDLYSTGTIDFTTKSGLVTPVGGYPFPISNLAEYDKDVLSFSYSMLREQLVESHSGQSFIVCWVTCHFNKKGEMVASDWVDGYPMTKQKTHKIVVYKQDEEQEVCSYTVTKDIGDLCIFIGANEPFCVSANDYSGLKSNSVYFAGYGSDFGVCDLSSQSILYFSGNVTPYPFFRMLWIPPTPTLAS